jgi:hypothetical protein
VYSRFVKISGSGKILGLMVILKISEKERENAGGLPIVIQLHIVTKLRWRRRYIVAKEWRTKRKRIIA